MEDPKQTFQIRFEGVSAHEAGTKARGLRQELLNASPDVSVSLAKDDPTNQDFGGTLVLLLGTPAVLAVANGIAAFLQRGRAKITISKSGAVVAENVTGEDAARIAEAFAAALKK
jgi:hypothetical protein